LVPDLKKNKNKKLLSKKDFFTLKNKLYSKWILFGYGERKKNFRQDWQNEGRIDWQKKNIYLKGGYIFSFFFFLQEIIAATLCVCVWGRNE